MRTYHLTDAEFEEILKASEPVPYIIIGHVAPESPQERANRVWQRIAKAHGFIWDSVQPAGRGDQKEILAEPVPPSEPVVDAIDQAQRKDNTP